MPRSQDRSKKCKTIKKVENPLPRSMEAGDTTKPIRTVIFVEVGDTNSKTVREIVSTILSGYETAHPHFAIPTRDGHLLTDIVFEQEFLDIVNELCKCDNGTIVFKKNYGDVDVIRKRF